MTPSPVNKQPADYKLPHNWLVRLAMDLATLCDMWRWKNDTSGCHLAIFSEDLAFARHFVVTHPPCRNASGIDYPNNWMPLVSLYRQPPCWKSSDDWLMIAIGHGFSYSLSAIGPPCGPFQPENFRAWLLPATLWLPTTPHPLLLYKCLWCW